MSFSIYTYVKKVAAEADNLAFPIGLTYQQKELNYFIKTPSTKSEHEAFYLEIPIKDTEGQDDTTHIPEVLPHFKLSEAHLTVDHSDDPFHYTAVYERSNADADLENISQIRVHVFYNDKGMRVSQRKMTYYADEHITSEEISYSDALKRNARPYMDLLNALITAQQNEYKALYTSYNSLTEAFDTCIDEIRETKKDHKENNTVILSEEDYSAIIDLSKKVATTIRAINAYRVHPYSTTYYDRFEEAFHQKDAETYVARISPDEVVEENAELTVVALDGKASQNKAKTKSHKRKTKHKAFQLLPKPNCQLTLPEDIEALFNESQHKKTVLNVFEQALKSGNVDEVKALYAQVSENPNIIKPLGAFCYEIFSSNKESWKDYYKEIADYLYQQQSEIYFLLLRTFSEFRKVTVFDNGSQIGACPLFEAFLTKNYELFCLFLSHGLDPNQEKVLFRSNVNSNETLFLGLLNMIEIYLFSINYGDSNLLKLYLDTLFKYHSEFTESFNQGTIFRLVPVNSGEGFANYCDKKGVSKDKKLGRKNQFNERKWLENKVSSSLFLGILKKYTTREAFHLDFVNNWEYLVYLSSETPSDQSIKNNIDYFILLETFLMPTLKIKSALIKLANVFFLANMVRKESTESALLCFNDADKFSTEIQKIEVSSTEGLRKIKHLFLVENLDYYHYVHALLNKIQEDFLSLSQDEQRELVDYFYKVDVKTKLYPTLAFLVSTLIPSPEFTDHQKMLNIADVLLDLDEEKDCSLSHVIWSSIRHLSVNEHLILMRTFKNYRQVKQNADALIKKQKAFIEQRFSAISDNINDASLEELSALVLVSFNSLWDVLTEERKKKYIVFVEELFGDLMCRANSRRLPVELICSIQMMKDNFAACFQFDKYIEHSTPSKRYIADTALHLNERVITTYSSEVLGSSSQESSVDNEEKNQVISLPSVSSSFFKTRSEQMKTLAENYKNSVRYARELGKIDEAIETCHKLIKLYKQMNISHINQNAATIEVITENFVFLDDAQLLLQELEKSKELSDEENSTGFICAIS